jgi:hypothetical protein
VTARFVALWLLALFAVAPLGAQGSPTEQQLASVSAVRVTVRYVDPGLLASGLDTAGLRRAVESRLDGSGVPVVGSGRRMPSDVATLAIDVAAPAHSYRGPLAAWHALELLPPRAAGAKVARPLWRSDTAYAYGSRRDVVRSLPHSVWGQAAGLVAAYRAAKFGGLYVPSPTYRSRPTRRAARG